jgi:pyrroline-5-carboxylate reductase
LGTVVNATSIEEFNGYGTAGSLMATYFGFLETAVHWMVDHGAEYERARTYLAQLFFGLAQTTIKSNANFETLIGAHSTPQGLNEQAYRVFAGSGGTDALVAAMESVAARINSAFT